MNEFLEQFLIEGRELVEQGVSDLLELEQNPGEKERLDSVFRAFHTLKGAAGIVDFGDMNRALHAVEDTLAAVRSGKRALTADLVTNCLASLDQVAAWLNAIETKGDIPENTGPAANRIVALFAHVAAPPPSAPVTVGGELARAHDLIAAQILLIEEQGDGAQGRLASAVRVAQNVLHHIGQDDEARRVGEASGAPLDAVKVAEALGRALGTLGGAEGAEQTGAVGREELGAKSLRIDVARVDALVKLTGELTTAKNAIGHLTELAKKGEAGDSLAAMLREQHATLDRLVSELQHAVLNVRVLPMRQVFQRFPRLVREMSAELDKPARLITEGETTEADKAIVENLFEPLLHVVRNAMDHGIEEAPVRAARGKAAVARIVMRASRSGDSVLVEIEDDGGGIDIERVRSLAVERGVVGEEVAQGLTDSEVVDLVFTPGFSTARTVTAISGRGVGMDAVRTAIANMGGAVEIENRAERGTLVRFLLPFTLMMTRVMVVHAGAQAVGIPFDAVVETVRAKRSSVSAIGAARAFVYRDITTPVIDLAEALGVERSASSNDDLVLVVTSYAGELTAFEVDRVASSLDIMLAPLDGLLSGVQGIAGATVLGDGAVLVVIDLHELARQAR